MDWLLKRQDAIERRLAKRHLEDGALVLYDLTSVWLEGRRCPLGRRGHSRDGKRGKPRIEFGLLCDAEGRPVAVEVFDGNTADPATVGAQIDKLRHRAGFSRVVLVGDRGMLTEARIREDVRPAGLDWISALRGPAVRSLVESGAVQLSLFDETDLVEIRSDAYPGERLMVCRNPLLAEERARKREDLLRATEALLDPIAAAARREKRRLKGEDKIGVRAGKVVGKYKMAKHFDLDIEEDAFGHRRKPESIAAEAALDGLYVVRTSLPAGELDAEGAVRAYKRLSAVERAFRSLKTVDLKVRPVFHRTADRVRAHVFLCMLAYYVEWHMRAAAQAAAVRRPRPGRRRGGAHIHRGAGAGLRSRQGKSPRQTHRQRSCRCTASAPCSATWRRSPGTGSSPKCPAPCRSKSSPGPPRYSAKSSCGSACVWNVPSSVPLYFINRP